MIKHEYFLINGLNYRYTYSSLQLYILRNDGKKFVDALDLVDGEQDQWSYTETQLRIPKSIGKSTVTFPIGFIGQTIFPVDTEKGLQHYLDGSNLVINNNTKKFLTELKQAILLHPSLATKTLEEWEEIKNRSAHGQCGKFFIDEENAFIRLPRVVISQGTLDLSTIADIKDAGAPNIIGQILGGGDVGDQSSYFTGAFAKTGNGPSKTDGPVGGRESWNNKANFDASRCSDVYGNSDTIQEEAIMYPYFIQIAAGVDVSINITNEIELINPYSLFDYKWVEMKRFNSSWRLGGTTIFKDVYPHAYNAILIESNPDISIGEMVTISGWSYIKCGLSVKLYNEIFTDYDFVLNKSEEFFILPKKTKFMPLNVYNDLKVVGDGMALGLKNGNDYFALQGSAEPNTTNAVEPNSSGYGVPEGTPIGFNPSGYHRQAYGVTPDPEKSGLKLYTDNTTDGIQLYWYVATTSQNTGLMNTAQIQAQFESLDKRPYKKSEYQNGISFCQVWENGLIEQGGRILRPAGQDQNNLITFLKPFTNLSSVFVLVSATDMSNGCKSTTGNVGGVEVGLGFVTLNNFKVGLNTGYSAEQYIYWYARGY